MKQPVFFQGIEAHNAVIAEMIHYGSIAAGDGFVLQQRLQFPFGAAHFRKIQLVGPQDQIMEPLQMRKAVMAHFHADVALIEKFLIGAHLLPGPVLLLQHPVLPQPLVLQILPGRSGSICNQLPDHFRAAGHQLRATVERFPQVGGIVVQKEHIGRPQLHIGNQLPDPLALGIPVDGGEHKKLCQSLFFQNRSDHVIVILAAYGIDNADVRQIGQQRPVFFRDCRAPFRNCSIPEGVVQIPDHQFDFFKPVHGISSVGSYFLKGAISKFPPSASLNHFTKSKYFSYSRLPSSQDFSRILPTSPVSAYLGICRA